MNEPEVVQKVHFFLKSQGVEGGAVSRLFTDPHPTLVGIDSLKPFQRFSVDLGHKVFHPDLIAQEPDGESIIAVEAKGSDLNFDWGLTQAEAYQRAVQRSFIAAPAAVLTKSMLLHAQSKGIGVLGVDDAVQILHLPEARSPLFRLYKALIADIGAAAWVVEGGTFLYNLPTHYLVWVTALYRSNLQGARQRLQGYPMPKDWRAALRGAQKLGLVYADGSDVRLTDVGSAVNDLLPATVQEWAQIHQQIKTSRAMTLYEVNRQAAAALRVLLLQDPLVRLVVEGLRSLGPEGGNFAQLARACSRLDRRRAAIFFVKPESLPLRSNDDGQVAWQAMEPQDYRSTTFFQYKSVLKHSGLIAPTSLGAAGTTSYLPERDVWQLLELPGQMKE